MKLLQVLCTMCLVCFTFTLLACVPPDTGTATQLASAKQLSSVELQKLYSVELSLKGINKKNGYDIAFKFTPDGKFTGSVWLPQKIKSFSGSWEIKGDKKCIDSGYGQNCYNVSQTPEGMFFETMVGQKSPKYKFTIK